MLTEDGVEDYDPLTRDVPTWSVADFKSKLGEEIGVTAWFHITQEAVDAFAVATDDRNFIHVNPPRAKEAGVLEGLQDGERRDKGGLGHGARRGARHGTRHVSRRDPDRILFYTLYIVPSRRVPVPHAGRVGPAGGVLVEADGLHALG